MSMLNDLKRTYSKMQSTCGPDSADGALQECIDGMETAIKQKRNEPQMEKVADAEAAASRPKAAKKKAAKKKA